MLTHDNTTHDVSLCSKMLVQWWWDRNLLHCLLSVSLSLSLSLFLSLSLSLSLCVSLALSVSLSLCVSLCLSVSLSLYVSLSLAVSLSLSLSLSVSFSLSLFLSLFLSVCVSLSLSLSVSLSLFVSFCLSLSVSLSISLSLSVSLSLFLSFSFSLNHWSESNITFLHSALQWTTQQHPVNTTYSRTQTLILEHNKQFVSMVTACCLWTVRHWSYFLGHMKKLMMMMMVMMKSASVDMRCSGGAVTVTKTSLISSLANSPMMNRSAVIGRLKSW